MQNITETHKREDKIKMPNNHPSREKKDIHLRFNTNRSNITVSNFNAMVSHYLLEQVS